MSECNLEKLFSIAHCLPLEKEDEEEPSTSPFSLTISVPKTMWCDAENSEEFEESMPPFYTKSESETVGFCNTSLRQQIVDFCNKFTDF